MRKIRELLRLKFDLGLSIHKIAASLSIARSTVTECLRRAAAAGVAWPLANELDEEELEARLYPKKQAAPDVAMPDFAHVQRDLSRPGVTPAAAVAGVQSPTPRRPAVQRILRSLPCLPRHRRAGDAL